MSENVVKVKNIKVVTPKDYKVSTVVEGGELVLNVERIGAVVADGNAIEVYTIDTDVSLTGRDLKGFNLYNREYDIKNWNELFKIVLNAVVSSRPLEFNKLYNEGYFDKTRGNGGYVVSLTTADNSKIALGSGYYADSNINSDTKKRILSAVLDRLGFGASILSVYVGGAKPVSTKVSFMLQGNNLYYKGCTEPTIGLLPLVSNSTVTMADKFDWVGCTPVSFRYKNGDAIMVSNWVDFTAKALNCFIADGYTDKLDMLISEECFYHFGESKINRKEKQYNNTVKLSNDFIIDTTIYDKGVEVQKLLEILIFEWCLNDSILSVTLQRVESCC